MNMHVASPLFVFLLILSNFTSSSYSISSLESFIYVGCSQLKYNPGTPYESNLNSILTSIVNSASYANYNNFKISLPGSGPDDVVYGLFQCRGDLSSSDCHECVAAAVTRLGTTCAGASGGALQLEGCFVRYDNTSFVGVQDKTVVSDKCGPLMSDDSEVLTRRDNVLSYLDAGGQYFRVSGSGKVQGVAQCVQDLSVSECQDCLSEAIQRLRTQCGSSAWGDMFLAKCYARYSERGYTSKSGNGEKFDGKSVFQPLDFPSKLLPLVYACPAPKESLHYRSLAGIDIKGNVVLCDKGCGIARGDRGGEVKKANGAAMILVTSNANTSAPPPTLISSPPQTCLISPELQLSDQFTPKFMKN